MPKNITVIGPGMMGHAIAQEFAVAGYPVHLFGRSEKRLSVARSRIRRNLTELVEWDILPAENVKPALRRITCVTDLKQAADKADLVIEAIVEDLNIKHDLFRKLDAACPKRTIFASNTSTLPPTVLATAVNRPDRVLVAHYFNPPCLMPLIELVKGEKTSDDTVNRVYHLMKRIGKKPIVCQREAAGFIVNRLQLVLWREAFNIVQRGIATPKEVDTAVKYSFGRRLGVAGPFEIYEHNDGYDLTLQCEKYMLPDMDRSEKSYPLLKEMVAENRLGAKTGKGFYDWTDEFTAAWRKRMLTNLVRHIRSDKTRMAGTTSPPRQKMKARR